MTDNSMDILLKLADVIDATRFEFDVGNDSVNRYIWLSNLWVTFPGIRRRGG